MTMVSVKIPDSLREKIEELGLESGFSLERLMASAASEKLNAMLGPDFLESEARKGSREAFDKVLASAPNVTPIHPGDVIM